jgi:hypothetical protein
MKRTRTVKNHPSVTTPSIIMIDLIDRLQFVDWSTDGDHNWKHNQALKGLRVLVGIDKPKRGLIQP